MQADLMRRLGQALFDAADQLVRDESGFVVIE